MIHRLMATALCAWLTLPSQSLAQCSGSIALEASLNGNESAIESGYFSANAEVIEVNIRQYSSSSTSSWASDLFVFITSPNGSCVFWGGWDITFPPIQNDNCTSLGTGQGVPWPDSWDNNTSSIYEAIIDVSEGNLSGTGQWTVGILNGWSNSGSVNYDIDFTIQGECLGDCPNPEACNYVLEDQQTNPLEEVCVFPEDLFGPGYDCDGLCISDVDGDGICDESDDCFGVYDECGNCAGTQTSGCIDEMACNYDSSASCDNGGCLYLDACGDCGGIGVLGCTDNFACNFDPNATCDNGGCLTLDECGECGGTGTLGCTDPVACNYDAGDPATCDDGSCLYQDATGVCGGECTEDADGDGICDACDQDGYWLDIEEVMVHSEGELDGMVTYHVSLACSSEADFLEAISGGGASALEIASTSGTWYNHPANPSWNPSGLVADSIALYPNLAFDSFLTIGADDADSGPFPVVLGWTVEDPLAEFEPGGGNNLLIDAGVGTCYFVFPGLSEIETHPGFAGDDLRVLLLQITTAGEISGQCILRIRPAGQSPFTQTLLFDSTSPCFNLDDCVFDVDEDGICDNVDDCIGVVDECGVCNGPGQIYECGCTDLPASDCDCDGNQLDAFGICGGDCAEDADADGICDDVDPCVGEIDACGVCNGEGAIYECGCADIPEEDCDCGGSQLDALGVCGGDCAEDLDEDGVCDDVDPCVGQQDESGECLPVPGFTGFSYELDTMFLAMDADDPLAALAYHGVYHVYAEFTSPNDVLSSLYSDVLAWGTPAMGIDAPCGCENSATESSVVDATINPAFFGEFPLLQYQTFWTIGLNAVGPGGELPSSVGIVGSEDVCAGFNISDGAIFLAGSEGAWASNAVAGDDLRVLIAQVVTCGDFEIQACVQTFVGGLQDSVSVQYSCPDEPLFVAFEGCTDMAACNYNPNASTDNGSCDFGCYGCTDPAAFNFDPSATINDGSCIYFAANCDFLGNPAWAEFAPGLYLGESQVEHELGVFVNGEFVLHVPGAILDGDGGSFNVLSWDNLVWSGLPEGISLVSGPTGAAANTQTCLTYSGTPFQEGVFQVTVTGDLMVSVFGNSVSAGEVASSFTMVITPTANGILGCTYSNASNFLPVATIDDGSCVYAGCTDPEASNFQIFATTDDGSCNSEPCDDGSASNMGDLNGDGFVGAGDLLQFLAVFGTSYLN